MTLVKVAAAFLLIGLGFGCAGKDVGHDVPPPGGVPKLHVPKVIQQKNGKA
jgi:hypothetical protein